MRKHLKPGIPAPASSGKASELPRTTPPQAAQSTQAWPWAAARLASSSDRNEKALETGNPRTGQLRQSVGVAAHDTAPGRPVHPGLALGRGALGFESIHRSEERSVAKERKA